MPSKMQTRNRPTILVDRLFFPPPYYLDIYKLTKSACCSQLPYFSHPLAFLLELSIKIGAKPKIRVPILSCHSIIVCRFDKDPFPKEQAMPLSAFDLAQRN
jgi:hypothetical protein